MSGADTCQARLRGPGPRRRRTSALTTSMSVAITSPGQDYELIAILVRRSGITRAEHPQLLDHRPHRPREVHAGRPDPRDHGRGRRARPQAPAARLDGPRARARDHDQGAGRARGVHGQRRPALPAAPDRHARARRLHLRGLALAGGVRRRAAARGRLAGRRGADRREHLPRGRLRPRADPRDEQDRPARRGAGAGGGRDRRADRQRPGWRAPHLREDGRRRDGAARGAGRADPATAGRPRRARRGR